MADAEYVATQQLSTAQIARILHLPPFMLGAPTGDSLTYSTVAEQATAFVRYSLGPQLRLIEEALSLDADLCPADHFIRANVDALQRADAKTRHEVYATAIASGVLTVNEARALEDLPPKEETDGPTD
jgi:HK97 family phage portal protein